MLKSDYISCILTIISTVLIGKKLWQGWVIAGANSIIICVIGMRSPQLDSFPLIFSASVSTRTIYGIGDRKPTSRLRSYVLRTDVPLKVMQREVL
jgi:hypothetical protein